nr:BBP7 family outer membrane beta-barrel protein [Bradyrhizobium sp. dw_411]
MPLKARPKPPPAPVWWTSAEALAWSVKSTPLPPLLTTFTLGSLSATTGFGGALGVPGTTVLSPDHLGYGVFPGGRLTLGRWLDFDPRYGVEASGFGLGSRSAGYSVISGGSPSLRVPFNNVSPAGLGFPVGSSSFVLADPGFANGSQFTKSSLQFWGIEGNGLYRVYSKDTLGVSLLAGVRYLDLREGLSIVSTEVQTGGATNGTYIGTDNFSTRNQFVGAQVGVKAQQQFGQFDGSLLAKVALGDNYQSVSINGTSSTTGFGLPVGVIPGGIFTQSTNIGQQSRNQFAVVPEAQVQLGYRVTGAFRIFVGYDFLYINNVVRPGNQIDTTLNLSGNSKISGVTPATLVGAARPAPQINGSDFWAQGAKVGASYAF